MNLTKCLALFWEISILPLSFAEYYEMIGGDKVYYRVAASILDPATFEREIAPLKKVQDILLLFRDKSIDSPRDGT